jgi:hypothetical protein
MSNGLVLVVVVVVCTRPHVLFENLFFEKLVTVRESETVSASHTHNRRHTRQKTAGVSIAILSDYKYSRCKYKQRYKYWCVRQNTATASTSNAINIGACGKGECAYVWVIQEKERKKNFAEDICHIQIYQKLSQH